MAAVGRRYVTECIKRTREYVRAAVDVVHPENSIVASLLK